MCQQSSILQFSSRISASKKGNNIKFSVWSWLIYSVRHSLMVFFVCGIIQLVFRYLCLSRIRFTVSNLFKFIYGHKLWNPHSPYRSPPTKQHWIVLFLFWSKFNGPFHTGYQTATGNRFPCLVVGISHNNWANKAILSESDDIRHRKLELMGEGSERRK